MDENTRIERDSLGEVHVPADAYYGAQTQRALENFPVSGIRFHRRFIQSLGIIKQAAAQVNGELGLLDARIADAIIQATEQVIAGELDRDFVLDIYQTGSGTSTNMNANEVIANLATELLGGTRGEKTVHPNDHVNMSQSSNDVIPSAIHISARRALEEELVPSLERFQDALQNKAEEFDDVIKSGRTHLMDATPVRLGQEFGGYARQIEQGVTRLRRTSEELAELALGGTATGTGINCPAEFPERVIRRIAEKVGLDFFEAKNHFEAQASKDACVSAAGGLNTLSSALMKMANDIRWLSSGPTSGLAEIRLPVIQPGSSIMPGKINPVMSESMMMVCARVTGNVQTITICNQQGNFQLNVMMPVMAHALLESIIILANVVEAFRVKCLEGIEANRERCREVVELNPSIATALNRAIGYDKAAEVVKKAAAENKPVPQVVQEMDLMSEEEVEAALDIRSMTEPGIPGRE
ncbi:MAG TPA: class II fumarate hydratase [bacterium]|nr:class II fumarate hydratase [bacterium]